MTTNDGLAVGLLDAAASENAGLVEQLSDLINDVYATAEQGLWRDGATRTTTIELAELIAGGQIAVATSPEGHIVGSVQIREVADDAREFGMLVARAGPARHRRRLGGGRRGSDRDFASPVTVNRNQNRDWDGL